MVDSDIGQTVEQDMLFYHTCLHFDNERDTRLPADAIMDEFVREYKQGHVPFLFEWGDGTGKVVFYPQEYQSCMCRLTWVQALDSKIMPYVAVSLKRAQDFLGGPKERLRVSFGILPKYTSLMSKRQFELYGMENCL